VSLIADPQRPSEPKRSRTKTSRASTIGEVPTLAQQPIGSRVVLGVPHLDPARTRRLAELGLRCGTEVVVLHRTAGRGRVLAIGETRLAFDRATLAALPVALTTEGRPTTASSAAVRDLA
jgi:ferrous iron transport protein A